MTIHFRTYTMDEAAELIHVSRRSMQEIVKRHPFYYVNGHKKLFTEADIAAIVTGLRQEALPCPSPSNRHAKASRQTGRSAAPTSASAWTRAQELLSKRSPSKSSTLRNEKSNVVELSRR